MRSALALLMAAVLGGTGGLTADPPFAPISGAGSTWSSNALDTWKASVHTYDMDVEYAANGSTDGRNQFRNGTVDYAVSEIPYGLRDEGTGTFDPPPGRGFVYMPVVAGGTAFMYNLRIAGQRVTNLRLSGENITKLFTGVITMWNDPAIKADNPGLNLPARKVVPVVRSDGSGTTAQFSMWMSKRYSQLWNAHCARSGRQTPCGITSYFPYPSGAGYVAQEGSRGVSTYVRGNNAEGAITYVEYSYPKGAEFPVAKVLNEGGYYVEPTAQNVAVALQKAEIDPADLTQKLDRVYDDRDKRTYPLSSYSYMVLPTRYEAGLNESKGYTLATFSYYVICEGQRAMSDLGYSPLPINLVQEGLRQIDKIPGRITQNVVLSKCNNPTFSTDGTNTLAKTAPYPPECDRKGGPLQCSTGTGGAKQPTTVTGVVPGASTDPSASADPSAVAGAGNGDGNAGGVAYVDGVPTDLGADRGWRLRHTLMLIAGLLLAGLIAGPPLLSGFLRRKGVKREAP